jgi:hypothetical protein
MDKNNSNFLNNPLKITQRDKKKELTKFQNCLKNNVIYNKDMCNVKQARFIVAKEKPNEIKTAYPAINPA